MCVCVDCIYVCLCECRCVLLCSGNDRCNYVWYRHIWLMERLITSSELVYKPSAKLPSHKFRILTYILTSVPDQTYVYEYVCVCVFVCMCV